MKRSLLIGIAVLFFSFTVRAQQPHNVEFTIDEIVQYYQNSLTFCDFDSITGVIVTKNPNYEGVPFLIDENDNVIHANSIIITEENDGKLVYIEKNNDLLISVNIRLLENDMPEPSSHGIWLAEGEMQQILPTPEDMGYHYIWTSNNWPIDSVYINYDLYFSNPGHYICDMFDECLHSSYIEYFANQDAWITYVTTNLNSGKNEIHWKSYIGSAYDTIAIKRNDSIIGYCEFLEEVWNDDTNNSEAQQEYSVYAIKNGEILTGPSTWKTGLRLDISNVNPESIGLYLEMPQYENTTPLQYQVQYMQLYEKHANGLGLIRSEIPVETTELNDIENIYDTLVLGGVMWDGTEIYSNFVMPNGITRLNENEEVDRVQVFPNPVTNGKLYISSEMKNAEYTISNMLGQKVQTGIASRQISVENLTSGVYIITLHNDDVITTTTKFVVEQ